MRIGDINKDNYNDYVKMFGGKNIKALDEMWGKDKKTKPAETEEEQVARLVKMGYIQEGMYFKEGDVSWKKTVHVSDDMKNKIHDLLRKEFAENNGMSDGEAFRALTKDYIKNSPVNERASVSWTLDQIWLEEAQRLTDYVKANDPNWNHGQPLDQNILDNYSSGGIDIKA